MFFCRYGPTRNLFGHNFLRDRLWSSQFRHRCDVEPLFACRHYSRAQKPKSSGANGREDAGGHA